jgi:hypothetical protein
MRLAVGWTDWLADEQAIHHISREILPRDGTPVETVAARMLNALAGHDILANAPVWDGRWLSTLLGAGSLSTNSLQHSGTRTTNAMAAAAIQSAVPPM